METLSIEHGPFIREKLEGLDTCLSEYSFPNLFLFREKHDYKIIEHKGNSYISGKSYNGESCLMPLEDLNNKDYFDGLIELLEDHDCIYPIAEKWLPIFEESTFDARFIEDDSDYIFEKDKLALYPGRKLSKKRNLVSQYVRDHQQLQIRPIDSCSKPKILNLLNLWQSRSEQEMGKSDFISCLKALEHFSELKLSGALFISDDEPNGFIIGENGGEDSYIIHFAKGDTDNKGIYQYMFQAYVREFCQDKKIINLEQDLGMEGLRKTKRSYKPDRMANKYRIYRSL